jgi:hypothetical protein
MVSESPSRAEVKCLAAGLSPLLFLSTAPPTNAAEHPTPAPVAAVRQGFDHRTYKTTPSHVPPPAATLARKLEEVVHRLGGPLVEVHAIHPIGLSERLQPC